MSDNDLIQQCFKKFDTDNSGLLEISEVKIALKEFASQDGDCYKIDPTDEEIKSIISGVDDNHDYRLSLTEFTELINAINQTGEEMKRQFEFFDKDGDGNISKSELKKSLKQLNQDFSKCTIKRMINDADLDGDGRISFEEFQRILISEAIE